MKRYLLYLLLAGLPAQATTYYVASNGNDANTAAQAQNPATPWQTLSRLNAAMALLQPGDQVLFRRGDTFRGQLVITRSGANGAPLTFGAYGPAAAPLPVLSGSTPLSGWVSAGPNVWEAPISGAAAVTGLYAANGRALPLGRYPNFSAANKGYLPIASHVGNTRLTSPQLSGNWTGATVVVRSMRWVIDRAPVTGHTGTTLTLGAFEAPYYTNNGLPDNWGFFLQNHPATLDQSGEWYYYPNRSVVRIYATQAPANGAVEAATASPAGVLINSQQYLTLENLAIARTPVTALRGNNVSHLVVRGVQILGADTNGIVLEGGGTNVLVENSVLRGVHNNGVHVVGYTDFTFRNNVLRSVGTVPGRGLGSDGQYYTFDIYGGDRVRLEGNTVDSCGYVGLGYFSTSNIAIARNVVSNYCLIKDDGGGIYTYNGGPIVNTVNARIENNMVFNGIGAPEGSPDSNYVPAYGIYLDDCTRNVTVQGNTVANCAAGGIYLHGNSQVTVTNNTCFNNGAQLVMAEAGSCANTGHTLRNNVLVAVSPGKMLVDYLSPISRVPQLGTLDGNYYAQPFDGALRLRYEFWNFLLSEWHTNFGLDANSTAVPVRYRPYRAASLTGPELMTNGTLTNGLGGWFDFTWSGRPAIGLDNTNALGTGPSIRLTATAPGLTGGMMAQHSMGNVVAGRRYIVRFSARCSVRPKLLEVFLHQSHDPYGDITSGGPRAVTLTTAPQTFEVELTPTMNDTNVLLALLAQEDNRTVWLDNISVREATFTPASEADSVRFEYNATAIPRAVTLPAGARYVDARNAAYSSSLVLAPFTSVVLFRINTATPTAMRPATGAAVQLWPNPSPGSSTLDLRTLPVNNYGLTLFDATGRAVRRFSLVGGSTHALDLAGLPAGVYLLLGQGESPGSRFSVQVLKE